MLAVPIIVLGVTLGVPFLIVYFFGDALPKGWPRTYVRIGAVAATIWFLHRWIDKGARMESGTTRKSQSNKRRLRLTTMHSCALPSGLVALATYTRPAS